MPYTTKPEEATMEYELSGQTVSMTEWVNDKLMTATGDACDANPITDSNRRAILRDFEGVVYQTSMYRFGEYLRLDKYAEEKHPEKLAELAEVMEGLEDYIIYDESLWSEVTDEYAQRDFEWFCECYKLDLETAQKVYAEQYVEQGLYYQYNGDSLDFDFDEKEFVEAVETAMKAQS